MGEIEKKFGVSFPPGRNTSITFMAHLWEPLRWIHKPLAVFLGAEIMCVATDALLYAQGFRSYRQQVDFPPRKVILDEGHIAMMVQPGH